MPMKFANFPVTVQLDDPFSQLNNWMAQAVAMAQILTDALEDETERNAAWALTDKLRDIDKLLQHN